MSPKNQTAFLVKIGVISAFAALSFLSTTIIRIPIPATGGYFNLGDTFVMVAALLFGPIVGAFVGLIGPTLADAIGFPQFILATAIVKSAEGLIVGLLGFRRTKKSDGLAAIALIVGACIIVVGYYFFEAMVYPLIAKTISFFAVTDKNAAIGELLPNAIQGLLSLLLAFGIYKAFARRKNADMA
jgi:uncharacterized membrane protein